MIAPASLFGHAPADARPADANPFIPISRPWRRALVAYFLVYMVATPVLQEIALPSPTPVAGVRLGAELLYQCLLFLPILFYRPWMGWLHPLVFPTVYTLANSLVKTPGELLAPLGIGLLPREPQLQMNLLPWYSEEVVAAADLRLHGIRILALLAYYAGFFLLARRRAQAPAPAVGPPVPPARVRAVAVTVAVAALVGVVVFLATRGGLQAHLVSYWGGGRGASATTGGLGIAVVGLDVCVVALLLWYALVPGVQRNPVFVVALAVTLPTVFLVTGSRSDLFYSLVLFVVIWMLRHRKVPTGRAAVLAALVLLLLAPMGDFRRTVTRSGQVDWGMLVDLKGAVQRTNSEIAMRASRGGALPLMVRVPNEVGFLNGRSYVGGLLFFVPRIVWKSKPNGAAFYNSTLILGRGAYGAPIPPEAEAFWNFDVPGLIVVYLLFGAFHRYLAGLFGRRGHDPVVWVPYVLALFYVVPSSLLLTTGARVLGASILMLGVMGAWKRRGAVRSRPDAAPVHGFRARPLVQTPGS